MYKTPPEGLQDIIEEPNPPSAQRLSDMHSKILLADQQQPSSDLERKLFELLADMTNQYIAAQAEGGE